MGGGPKASSLLARLRDVSLQEELDNGAVALLDLEELEPGPAYGDRVVLVQAAGQVRCRAPGRAPCTFCLLRPCCDSKRRC